MPFIANTDEQRREMLRAIGVERFEELIDNIPERVRLNRPLQLPPALSQFEVADHLAELAAKNKNLHEYVSFLGAGAYDHYIPPAVNHILLRPEFYTSYTPYQAEVSQGNLQVIYEYQSMICELTGMFAANASMYDGGSALAEAVLMARGATGRNTVLLSEAIHPFYRTIVETYSRNIQVELRQIPAYADGITSVAAMREAVDDTVAAVVVQHPNFLGNLENVNEMAEIAHQAGALFIVSVDPLSLAVLEPPGRYGADIVVGDAQCFGNALSYGGPYVGIFATTEKLLRRMPGRIAGATVDRRGNRGFVLTLQTREQHIRREKATSNICTNQALNATAATIYLALMGKEGLKEVAHQSLQKAHYLADQIQSLSGYSLAYSVPFFKEFVVKTPVPAQRITDALLQERIFAGLPLNSYYGDEHALLIAVTEKRRRDEMDRFVELLSKFE